MQKIVDAKPDPEAVLLARVYGLILSWVEAAADLTMADAANAPKQLKKHNKKREEDKRNE